MRKQPLHFRREEVSYVTQRWQAMESCALIGVGSVGKSNLLHHLASIDVQQHYMREQSKKFKSIIIDPNLLGAIDSDATDTFKCWAGYELMMHRLYMAFYPFDALGEEAADFFDTYRTLQDGTNPLFAYMGLRYFELGLEFFLRRGFQIVFMFDEFEELMRQMPAKFFQTLRGLRDNYKTQLAHLTFSREPIPIIANRFNHPNMEVEPFVELFTDNEYYVGPYNETDARDMVERLKARNPQLQHSPEAIQFLLDATGGYAGLLRAGFRALQFISDIDANAINDSHKINRLASRRTVASECSIIWKSLTDTEQRLLTLLVTGNYEIDKNTEKAIPLLVRKRLLKVNRDTQYITIQPPIFSAYVAMHQASNES